MEAVDDSRLGMGSDRDGMKAVIPGEKPDV
jgi:hypothetical protein